MSILNPVLDSVEDADIAQLVENGTVEGLQIEYKRDMYGTSDADKKDFLKDVSSFANSSGGHLVIGVDEEQGIASAVTPVAGNPDTELQRLEQMARTALEPRVVGMQMRAVPIAAGGSVFVIRVPRSWNPPHRVSYQNSNRFYLRSSAGAHEASVEELRAIFANGADMRGRMIAYINERTQKIADNEAIVPLAVGEGTEGKLALHVLPFSAFACGEQIDVAAAEGLSVMLHPLGANGAARINFDGLLSVRGGEVPHGYTQVFRNGIIEATKVRITAAHQQGWRIPSRSFVEPVFQRLPSYVRALQSLGVPPPFGISLTLMDVMGSFVGINDVWGYDDQHTIDWPILALPMQVIPDFGSDSSYRTAIKPAIDALWNAVGLPSAAAFLANYNEDGAWIG